MKINVSDFWAPYVATGDIEFLTLSLDELHKCINAFHHTEAGWRTTDIDFAPYTTSFNTMMNMYDDQCSFNEEDDIECMTIDEFYPQWAKMMIETYES